MPFAAWGTDTGRLNNGLLQNSLMIPRRTKIEA